MTSNNWAGIDQTEPCIAGFFPEDHSNDTRNIKCNVTNSVDIINLEPTVKKEMAKYQLQK